MKFKTFKVIYNPFPNAPGSRSEVFINATDEMDAKRQFEDFSFPKPPGSSVVEITEV